jgi:Flp pilus assembly protein TadG
MNGPSLLRLFRAEQGGVVAIEFALIAPLMLVLYFGLAEATLALMAEKRASHLAATIADLVAQEPETDVATLGGLVEAAPAIMRPFAADTSTLQVRVSSLAADGEGVVTVAWSYASTGLSRREPDTEVTDMPEDLLEAGEGLVMAEVLYEHRPLTGMVVRNTLEFNERFYLRPRKTSQVACTNCPP